MNLPVIVKRFEGLSLKAYLCPAGVPTIGYGATGPDIKLGDVWTQDQAEARLVHDTSRMLATTLALCPELRGDEPRTLAIADFAYNLGPTRLAASTLRVKIRARDWVSAGAQLMKWVRGGARILPGLVQRRAFERQLLLGAST